MINISEKLLPEGWTLKPLGEIAYLVSGSTPRRSNNSYWQKGTIPWLKSGELNDVIGIKENSEFITEKAVSDTSVKLFEKDTLLIAMYGATAGKLGILSIKATTNQAVCSIQNIYEAFNNHYIFYFLLSSRAKIIKDSFGGAQPNISKSYLEKILIPLPPIEEQNRLVAKIDTLFLRIDKAISLTEESLAQVKNLLPSALKKVFDNCEGAIMKLNDVSVIQPKKNQVKDLECNVSFVPMKYLEEKKIDFTPESDKNITDVYKGYTYFQDDDVLLAKVIPCFQNGKSGVAKGLTNGIGFGSSEFIVFRPKGFILSEWLYYNISSPDFLREGNKNMSGAVGLKRLTKSFVSDWEIKVPDLKRQKEFVDRITKISNHSKITQTKLEEQLDYLKHLKSSILSKAFKGEL